MGSATRFRLTFAPPIPHAEVAPFPRQRYVAAAAYLQRDLTSTSTASFNPFTKAEFDGFPTTTHAERCFRPQKAPARIEYELDWATRAWTAT
jgi:hypothetical protein